jgi:acyl carrier protein
MKTITLEQIKATLKEIIRTDLEVNINPADISEDVSLYDDGLGLDSIAIINLIVTIEKRFDMSFDESEISSSLFSSLNNLAAFIYARSTAPAKELSN